ncbi:MAG: NifB/NifX family molybdenum-iron cluster-binding protein [Oscillospiraceae bacterium]
MRIAVAYKDGEIFEHFGHCEMFAIYDYEDADVNKCTKRLVETAGREGHKAMSDLMREEKEQMTRSSPGTWAARQRRSCSATA